MNPITIYYNWLKKENKESDGNVYVAAIVIAIAIIIAVVAAAVTVVAAAAAAVTVVAAAAAAVAAAAAAAAGKKKATYSILGIIFLGGLNLINSLQVNIEVWMIGIIIIIIAESYFIFLDKEKPKSKENKLKFTLKRKALAFAISGIIVSQIIGGYKTILNTIDFFKINISTLMTIGWILLMIFGVFGITYGYIYLNSLKYRRGKK